jgi:hypothetical protein
MNTVPTNPSAVVALRMLTALDVTDRAQARAALIQWCRPSPRLSLLDVQQIMAAYPADVPSRDDEDVRDAKPDMPITGGEHDGFPLGKRNGPDETP